MGFTERLTLVLADEAATEGLAARAAQLARAGDAILLGGPMGAGKSTFARAFLRAATGDARLRVPSPTFTLAQGYALPGGITATHYDLWRLADAGDLAELGFDEARAGIVLVEWPERAALAEPDALNVTLAPHGEGRIAELSGWPDRLGGLA
jgi:tRNA threonylcarbamoyladenosine biosynthesis protein TsaE